MYLPTARHKLNIETQAGLTRPCAEETERRCSVENEKQAAEKMKQSLLTRKQGLSVDQCFDYV